MKSYVVGCAAGVIIGGASGNVVTAMAKDVLMSPSAGGCTVHKFDELVKHNQSGHFHRPSYH